MILLLLSGLAFGADILEFRLVKDGSVEPPGDQLTLTALLLPNETSIVYEIRPIELIKEIEHQPISAAKTSRFRDENGFLVFKGRMARGRDSADSNRAEVSVAIPYQEIALPLGAHQFYYEATLTVMEGDKSHEPTVLATRLTEVLVGDGSRDTITRPKFIASKPIEDTREVVAYALGADGKVQEKKTELPATIISAGTFEPEKFKVNIPGKFERKEVSGRPVQPTVPLSKFTPDKLRIVRFATNRKAVDSNDLKKGFTSELGELTYGTCTVNIPVKTHKKGQLKTPGWFGSNPKTDFSIELILPKDETPFYKELSETDKLIYVHGYRNKFDDAILTAAQLQHDIEFGGKVIAFSWPSKGTTPGYWDDEKAAEKSVDHLALVIEKLLKGESTVNIIAHSMGNRVTLYALNKLITDKRIDEDTKVIQNLVLAAPDVDINVFMSLIGRVSKVTQRITFYYSTKDMALWLSAENSPMNRAGAHPTFFQGMETVSVDNVNSPFASYGHGYFTTSDRVLLDIKLDVVRKLKAQFRRPPLKSPATLKNFPGFLHYSFVPN